MDSTYKIAIAYATQGLAIATATRNTSYGTALTAMRARAEFAKAVWAKLHPLGSSIPIGGAPALIDDPAANADAAAALALAGAADWRTTWWMTPGPIRYRAASRSTSAVSPISDRLSVHARARSVSLSDGNVIERKPGSSGTLPSGLVRTTIGPGCWRIT